MIVYFRGKSINLDSAECSQVINVDKLEPYSIVAISAKTKKDIDAAAQLAESLKSIGMMDIIIKKHICLLFIESEVADIKVFDKDVMNKLGWYYRPMHVN